MVYHAIRAVAERVPAAATIVGLAMAMALLCGAQVDAQTVTVTLAQGVSDADGPNPDYQTDDTHLHSAGVPLEGGAAYADRNWGAAPELSLGRELGALVRIVFRFGLESVDGETYAVTGARVVLSAKETFTFGEQREFLLPLELELAPLTAANAGWTEGDGILSVSEGATWNRQLSPDLPWAGSPGLETDGVDTIAGAEAHAQSSAGWWFVGDAWTFEIEALDVIEGWVASPETNAGFVLRSSYFDDVVTTGSVQRISFFADDATSATLRPRLELDLTPRVEPTPTPTPTPTPVPTRAGRGWRGYR